MRRVDGDGLPVHLILFRFNPEVLRDLLLFILRNFLVQHEPHSCVPTAIHTVAVAVGRNGRQWVAWPLDAGRRPIHWLGRVPELLPVFPVGVSRDVARLGLFVEGDASGQESVCGEGGPDRCLGAVVCIQL